MLIALLLLACSANPDGDGPAGKVTQEDLAELLDRVEELEAEVAALRNAGAPVGIDADADGDGLREWDGLPVGTRRGDVLYDWTCSAAGEVPPAAPGWMTAAWDRLDAEGRLALLAFACWSMDGAGGATMWGGPTTLPRGDWPFEMHEEDVGLYRVQCVAI